MRGGDFAQRQTRISAAHRPWLARHAALIAPVQLRLPTIRLRRRRNATSAAAIASVAPNPLKNRRKSVAPPSAEFQVSCRPENYVGTSCRHSTCNTDAAHFRNTPHFGPCVARGHYTSPNSLPEAIFLAVGNSLEKPSPVEGGHKMPFPCRKSAHPAAARRQTEMSAPPQRRIPTRSASEGPPRPARAER